MHGRQSLQFILKKLGKVSYEIIHTCMLGTFQIVVAANGQNNWWPNYEGQVDKFMKLTLSML